MSTHADLVIVLRALVTLRATQRALHLTERRTPAYSRLLTSVMAQERQIDHALDYVMDQLFDREDAADD